MLVLGGNFREYQRKNCKSQKVFCIFALYGEKKIKLWMTTIDFRSSVHKRITALRGTTLYTDHYTELTVVVRWSPPVAADSSPPGTPPFRHTLTYRAPTIQLIRITKKTSTENCKKNSGCKDSLARIAYEAPREDSVVYDFSVLPSQ
jgi:hypothetical protein